MTTEKLLETMKTCISSSDCPPSCPYIDNDSCCDHTRLISDAIFAIEMLSDDRDEWKEAAIKLKESL